MNVYTVACKSRVCAGHNDYYEEQKIIRIGGFYGTGGVWPTLFKTEEQALSYKESLKYEYSYEVVCLELCEEED